MKKKETFRFLTDKERGIDPTTLMANDCDRIQNAPIARAIPRWWIDEALDEKDFACALELLRQITSGEAILDEY